MYLEIAGFINTFHFQRTRSFLLLEILHNVAVAFLFLSSPIIFMQTHGVAEATGLLTNVYAQKHVYKHMTSQMCCDWPGMSLINVASFSFRRNVFHELPWPELL